MPTITMPQLGETVTEGTITRWLKQVGDSVATDELLFEVSTDKVDSEVPSPEAGYVAEILVEEGETVDVGTKLAVVTSEKPSGDGQKAEAQEKEEETAEVEEEEEEKEEQAPEGEAEAEQEEAEEELNIDYGGDSLDIGFNVIYLLDVLNNLDTNEIDCAVGDANSSMLIVMR